MKKSSSLGIEAIGILLAILVLACAYQNTIRSIDVYRERCGAYPTLDEAIAADLRYNGYDPNWFEPFSKAQYRNGVPFSWYVIYRSKLEFQDEVDARPIPAEWCGGSIYLHTIYGWVGMPENFWNATGIMNLLMNLFRLNAD